MVDKYAEPNSKVEITVHPNKKNNLKKLVDSLYSYPLKDCHPQVRKKLTDLLNLFSTSLFANNSPIVGYHLPFSKYEDIRSTLESLLSGHSGLVDNELHHILTEIYVSWISLASLKNGQELFDHKHLRGLIEQLTTRQEEINARAKSVVDEIKERSDSAASNIARHAQRHTNQLSIQANELKSELLSQIETTASNAKIDVKDESSKLWRELTEKITTTIDSTLEAKQKEIHNRNERQSKLLLEKVESDVSTLSNKVNEQINEFCLLNEALRKTLNFVASDALADTSIRQAEEEKQTADTLRGWGVAWLIASIGLFLITFDYDKLIDDNNVPQYALILLRSFFLIVGIAPGFYLLRESARHRTDERRYRQKGIQLATIDGYFAEFDDSERNKVKKDLSKHYFHGAEHFVDSSSVDNVQSRYDKVFDKVLQSKKFN